MMDEMDERIDRAKKLAGRICEVHEKFERALTELKIPEKQWGWLALLFASNQVGSCAKEFVELRQQFTTLEEFLLDCARREEQGEGAEVNELVRMILSRGRYHTGQVMSALGYQLRDIEQQVEIMNQVNGIAAD